MSSKQRFYYLQNNYMPLYVHAEKRSNGFWYIPKLKLTVSENDLFVELNVLSSKALIRLRKRRKEAEKKLRELSDLVDSEKPHPNAKATKIPYLWLIKNE